MCDAIKEALGDAEQELGKMSIEYSSTKNRDMKTRVTPAVIQIDIYKKELQTYKK